MATECRKRLSDPHERYFAGGDAEVGGMISYGKKENNIVNFTLKSFVSLLSLSEQNDYMQPI